MPAGIWRPAIAFGGMPFATVLPVLHFDSLTLPTPQLPTRQLRALKQLTASGAAHVMALAIVVVFRTTVAPRAEVLPTPAVDQAVSHIVFVLPETPRIGGGGGGGGNRQPGPIRHAQAIGRDEITLRVRSTPPPIPAPMASRSPIEEAPQLPAIVLAAKPVASGFFDEIGLPARGILSAPSTGPGSGGGFGSGSGTGIGSGRGPGLGPGSGGGTGGGFYRPGGAVTAPLLIRQVRPSYTSEALRIRLQGSVVLELIVTEDGCTSHIRVVKSLDRGLDQEAIAAVAQWHFEPGRFAGAPVAVLVQAIVDFRVW